MTVCSISSRKFAIPSLYSLTNITGIPFFLAFELNTGSKFQEAINDLNIIRIDEYKEIKIVVEFENQATLTGEIGEDQLYDKTFTGMSVYLPDNIRPSSCIEIIDKQFVIDMIPELFYPFFI